MFEYSDPTGTGLLATSGAMSVFRGLIDRLYQNSGRIPGSAFATLDAFAQVSPGIAVNDGEIEWAGYPLQNSDFSDGDIDARRFDLQDEYVEWRVETSGGNISRITFTTEFPEYYQALAAISVDALIEGIQAVHPGADPTTAELFGAAATAAQLGDPLFRARAIKERAHVNPWNNGQKGILFLTQGQNTMGALFTLVDRCAIPRPNLPVGSVCGISPCGDGRNSDPRICAAAQGESRVGNAITLTDPVGIEIVKLEGSWAINGTSIPNVNTDPSIWSVSRNGRRATLTVKPGLTLDGNAITTGTQVSRVLKVHARVQTVPDAELPIWARLGNEGTRA